MPTTDPTPTALAAWLAEQRQMAADLMEDDREELAKLAAIEAATTAEHDGGNGVLHTFEGYSRDRYLLEGCILCAALTNLTNGERHG